MSGIVLVLISLFGRNAVLASVGGPWAKAANLSEEPEERIAGSGGCRLSVRRYGPSEGRVIVLTCGGGADATLWDGVIAELASRFRLLVWDPAGVGLSDPPYDGCYSIDRFGGDLEAVLALAEGRPALLVGHDAGGLAALALCANKPCLVGRQIAGLALLDLPPRPESGRRSGVYDALLTLDIWASPVVRLMNWASYMNGSAHLLVRALGFGLAPTRAGLDQAALMHARQCPAVRAKGQRAVRAWASSGTSIAVRAPVLILSGEEEVKPEAIAARVRATPEPVFQTLQGAGTLGPIEAPAAWAEAIARHAEQVFELAETKRKAREADRLRARSPIWSVAAEPASWERDPPVDCEERALDPGVGLRGPTASYVIGHA